MSQPGIGDFYSIVSAFPRGILAENGELSIPSRKRALIEAQKNVIARLESELTSLENVNLQPIRLSFDDVQNRTRVDFLIRTRGQEARLSPAVSASVVLVDGHEVIAQAYLPLDDPRFAPSLFLSNFSDSYVLPGAVQLTALTPELGAVLLRIRDRSVAKRESLSLSPAARFELRFTSSDGAQEAFPFLVGANEIESYLNPPERYLKSSPRVRELYELYESGKITRSELETRRGQKCGYFFAKVAEPAQ